MRRARVVHPAEPGAPRAATAPAPTRVRARGVGTGRVAGCGAAGEWGIGRSPQPREVLEVRGMGRNPAIGLYRRSALLLLPPPQMRPSRAGLGLGLHSDPSSGRARASSAPRAGPALRPLKLVSLLCWALLELVALTPRFYFFFSGALFCGEGKEGGGFLPLPRARAHTRFPAPRRAWVPPLAGSGAGCTRVAVHAVGVHWFPAPVGAACAPPPACSWPPSPAS